MGGVAACVLLRTSWLVTLHAPPNSKAADPTSVEGLLLDEGLCWKTRLRRDINGKYLDSPQKVLFFCHCLAAFPLLGDRGVVRMPVPELKWFVSAIRASRYQDSFAHRLHKLRP